MSGSSATRPDQPGPDAARLAGGLADQGDVSDAIGFVEGVQHLQARYVDGHLTGQASRLDGGLSWTALDGGRWAMGALPWSATTGRGIAGLSVDALAAVRTSMTALDDSVPARLQQLESRLPPPPPGCTTEVIADVVTRRKAVARRGSEAQVEVSQWTRLRSRAVDLGRGLEFDRRQWVGRGPTIDDGTVLPEVARPAGPGDRATVRSGRYVTPVVLEGSASACLLHELLGHVAEQDSLSRPTAFARAVETVTDAHPELTVVDDPGLLGGAGRHGIDDEGTPAERTAIMTGGRFVSGLGTVMYPSPVSGAGCARRSGYASVPLPRASNTVVEPGGATREELLAGPEVLVITGFASGYVVPTTGDFQFVATRCRVEGGNGPATPVGDVLVNGNALDVLRAISAVGSDTGTTAVTCGKRNQWLVVTMVSPSLRVDRLEWSCA